jgi:hypothetical protein
MYVSVFTACIGYGVLQRIHLDSVISDIRNNTPPPLLVRYNEDLL